MTSGNLQEETCLAVQVLEGLLSVLFTPQAPLGDPRKARFVSLLALASAADGG